MPAAKMTVEIDENLCDGCGLCLPACHEGAIQIVDGKARLIEELCDGLGACLGECPRGAIRMIEESPLAPPARAGARPAPSEAALDCPPEPCGCPGAQVRQFGNRGQEPVAVPRDDSGKRGQELVAVPTLRIRGDSDKRGQLPVSVPGLAADDSALSHWPVQINLVHPRAAFLAGADLLIAADCVPVAHPNFHRDFLAGRSVLIGCPKFDDLDAYIDRFEAIFRAASIKSVTVVAMEVPCCQALPAAVREALRRAGKTIPFTTTVIGITGETRDRNR